MARTCWVIAITWMVGVVLVPLAGAQEIFPPSPLQGGTVTMVLPTVADPSLKTTEDDANVVVMPAQVRKTELFVWLPGTNGHPRGDSAILSTAAEGGYRTIGLQYNDHRTAEMACGEADPECYTHFRQERFTGDAPDAAIPNTPNEGGEHRLTMLLKYLAVHLPGQGWDTYLKGDQPNWSRIVLAGHSQGAGEAGFIAKKREVARVVLFSGASDGVGQTLTTRKWSSWLTAPSKTPMERWYAEYNAQERLAEAEPMAYESVLGVPANHVLVFKLDLPPAAPQKLLAAHMAVVHDPRYRPDWEWMLGLTEKRPSE